MAAGGSGCAQHQERKKGLLVAISSSVDKIISHFSTTRNIVQKAQLGDSRLSPEVGHLILNTLCPAFYALVGDRLKPFQKDVIAGRRRTSPWTLVEASVRPGPATRSLHGLYCKICQLPQLSSSKKKFNAFVLGLLNAKLLDFWISHLQENSGTLSLLYLPGGFLSLTEDSFQPHFDELLLLIQPLSILTFHLDLLFEHHHLRVNLRLLQLSGGQPSCQTQGPIPPVGLKWGHGLSYREEANPQETAKGNCTEHGGPQDGHPAVKEESGGADTAGSEPRGPAANPPPVIKHCPSPQTGGPLQHTLQQVLQWGGKLTQTLVGQEEFPANSFKAPASETCTKPPEEKRGSDAKTKATTWWGQLSQASQVYSTPNKESFPFTRWTKLRIATVDNCPATPTNQRNKKPERDQRVAKVHGEDLGTELHMMKTPAQGNPRVRQSDNLEGSPKSKGESSSIHGRYVPHPPTCGNGASARGGPPLDSSTQRKEGDEPQEWLDQRQQGTQESHEEGNQVPRPKESSDHGTPGSQESSGHGTPGSQESSGHGTPGSQESSGHGTPGSQESSGHGTPGTQESSGHGTPGTQESSGHGTPGTQESSGHGTLGSQESSGHGTLGSQESPDEGNRVPRPQESIDKKSCGTIPQKSHVKGNPGTHAIAGEGPAPCPGEADSPSSGRGIWLGHLFGAQCSSSRGSPTEGETNSMKSRRPSSWLPPNMNILGLVRKVVPPEKTTLPEKTSKDPEDTPKPVRTVRALCDHSGSEQSHLSFRKDDVLQLLATVDEDWIRCCHGNSTGLVPVGYTSLIL